MAQTIDAQNVVELIGRGFHRLVPEKYKSEFFWQREKQHLLTLIQRDPKLAECDPDSLARAVSNAGAMGLSLNPVLGHCYLITRRERKRKDGESWADYERDVGSLAYAVPSYMGMADLAVKSERIMQVVAEVVFDADQFRYHGPLHAPTHEAVHRAADREYAKAVGVYAVARLRERATFAPDGVFQCVYLDRVMIERIRAMSETPNSRMWDPAQVWTEGWKKAAVRRLWKLLPKSPAMLEAMRAADEAEGFVETEDPPPPAEKVIALVSDADVAELRQMLVQGGVKEGEPMNRWVERIALRFEVATLAELPKDELPKVRKLITEAMVEAKRRQEAAKAPQGAQAATTAPDDKA